MNGRFFVNLFAKFSIKSEDNLTPLRLNATMARNYKDEFPEVPDPETKLSPEIVAAGWVCEDIRSEQMPAIAADLLEVGFDTPSLRRLAGEIQVLNRADVEPLVEKLFHELNFPYPIDEEHAKLILTRQLAREVIAGKKDLITAAYYLEMIWRWTAEVEGLPDLFMLNESLSYEMKYRRTEEEIQNEMIKIFAQLAMMTDEQIANPSSH